MDESIQHKNLRRNDDLTKKGLSKPRKPSEE